MSGFPGGSRFFFDAAAVLKATDAAERRVLSKFGAFVRTRAVSSIRTRKGVSRPGSPPSSHTGLLKRFLFFAWEPASRSVVVGPAALRSSPTAPRLLEFGGTAAGKGSRRGTTRFYRPRPFMAPAEAAERPKFAGLFQGQIGG